MARPTLWWWRRPPRAICGFWLGKSWYGPGRGHIDFTLWPAVPARVTKLHVVVATLWEAAWEDIELPRGSVRPGVAVPGPGYQHDDAAGYMPPAGSRIAGPDPAGSNARRLEPLAVPPVRRQ